MLWDFLYLSVYPSLLRFAILSNPAPAARVSRLCCFAYTQINDKLAFCKDRSDCRRNGLAMFWKSSEIGIDSVLQIKHVMLCWSESAAARVEYSFSPRAAICFYTPSHRSCGNLEHTSYSFTRVIHCDPAPKIVLINQSVLNETHLSTCLLQKNKELTKETGF